MTRFALFALAAGCTPGVQFTDDFDFRFDLRRVAGPDALATPYVEGTPVRITLTSPRDMDRFVVESSDPSVFRIDEERTTEDETVLLCTAVGPGEAELVVRRASNDRVVDGAVIEVGRPDRIELHAAGAVFAMLGDDASETFDPTLLAGGLATFEARWFDGDTRLFGNRVLSAVGDGVEAWDDQTFLFENREWLRLRAGATPGPAEVELRHLGQPLALHRVEIVDRSAAHALAIVGLGESGALAGDTITLLGQVADATGRPIFGAEHDWFLGSVRERGTGDLYRYTFDPALPNDLTARFDGLEDAVAIRGTGFVDSSNHIGCSTSGLGGLGIWVCALGLVRRRSTVPEPRA